MCVLRKSVLVIYPVCVVLRAVTSTSKRVDGTAASTKASDRGVGRMEKQHERKAA